MTKKQKWLVFTPVVIIGFFVLLLIFGLAKASFAMASLGSSIGVYIGAKAGNKKAREVDAYREEWLAKRRGGKGNPAASEKNEPLGNDSSSQDGRN